MGSLLVVGSIAFDSIKTPSGVAEKALGGSANYFSLSASHHNPVNVVGVVGEDFPEDHIKELNRREINTDGVQRVDGKTFHWEGEYKADDLNEAITHKTELNVFENFDPKLPESYLNSDYLFLGNIDPNLQNHVLDQVKDPRITALDSMNFWIDSKLDDLKTVLSRVDVLSINEGEAMMLSGKDNLLLASEELLRTGPKVIIVKQGSYGAMLFTKDFIFSAPALPLREVKDPTGAGDTFAGGFMGYLASQDATLDDTQTLKRAVIYGSVMASYVIEDFSVSRLMKLEKHEIDKRYNQFVELTRV
jgi:sugar/nucleoside kinase (ribokinase family)